MSVLDIAIAGQVLVFVLVVAIFIASGQASIFHPLTWYLGFHALMFVVRPAVVHYLGFDSEWYYMHFEPTENQLLRALAVSSVGLVAFAVSCFLFGRCKTRFRSPAPEPFRREDKVSLIILTLLLGPLVAYSIRSQLNGEMKGEHIGGTFVMTGASGYTLEAQYMAGPLICAWLAVTRFRWQALLVLVPYICYRSFVGMSRWTMVLLLLALGLVYCWQNRKKWPPVWAAAGIIPLFLLFHALGLNRGAMQEYFQGGEFKRTTSQTGMTDSEKLKAEYDGPDFANFDFLTYVTAKVPESTGMYTYGSQYLQLFTEPIPRKIWKGKPIGAPVNSFNLNNYGNFLGRTVGLVGDGWISGGWIGLLITLSLAGGILGLAHRWFWEHSASNMRSVLYLIALAMLPQWYRDGGISIVKFVFWNLLPLVLWWGLIWLLGPRLVPVYSVVIARGSIGRLIRPAQPNPAAGAEIAEAAAASRQT